MLHLPDGAGETGRWCARSPPGGGAGIPPQPARAGPHFHCATGFRKRGDPLTRARVRLLGPCFKTGRVGCRHRRRPLAPAGERGPVPALGDATRSGRTEDSPPRSGSRAGSGGPRPRRCPRPPRRQPRRTARGGRRERAERAQRALNPAAPGSGEVRAGGAVKRAAGAACHLRPEPFQADPEPVAAHRRRRKCARRGPAAPGGGSLEEIPPHRAAVPFSPS